MRTIIKNGQVLNVHTERFEKKNIVIEGERIVSLADSPVVVAKGDTVIDAEGNLIIPGPDRCSRARDLGQSWRTRAPAP